jgi:DNA-binding CsgD family transcriptional regulator/PAS domain-containing protein
LAAARDIDFVQDVYDAALDPRGLHVLTDLVRTTFDGGAAVLQLLAGRDAYAIATSNVSDRVLGLYADRYHAVNPLLPAALERLPVGRSALLSDFLPERDYFESEFFRDFAKSAGTVWMVGIMVPFAPSRCAAFAIHRPQGDPAFTAADRARLQRLLGPLGGALRLRRRLERADGAAGLAALDAMAFGTVICEGDGRVVFANRAAEALAEKNCGLALGGSSPGVAATLPNDASRLARLIADAAEHARAGAMSVTDPAGDRLLLLVTPLPRPFGEAGGRVLVTMRSARAAPLADPATLGAVLGLTPAEARVAAALSTGAGAAEIAAGFDVAEQTVRTHIKRLLDKAGVASQREFLALIALLPPVDRAAKENGPVSRKERRTDEMVD